MTSFVPGQNPPDGRDRGGGGPSPTDDECLDRLHRAGWSIGEVGTATGWLVIGTNGENSVKAAGRTQTEAWWNACQQAQAVGMLAPPRGDVA
jgi:hypothetical protein